MHIAYLHFCCAATLVLLHCVTAPPPPRKEAPEAAPEHKPNEAELNLPYERYLREVVKELEKDEAFQKKLATLDPEEVKKGNIADHIDELGLDIRTKLNDIKVREIERLRELLTKEIELKGHENVDVDRHIAHLDSGDLQTFGSEDLRKLIKQTVTDLDELDKARREDFKRYEMKKEAMRQHAMANMTEEQRRQAEAKHKRNVEAHKQHPDLHHPGGKEQLEEVWEETDKMEGSEFDPKTFFALHDLDGNGYWDEMEIEALFQRELDKVYNESNPSEDDMRERDEEMSRMREHVINEMDKDRDKMISLQEFLDETQTPEFKQDDAWETLDQQKEPIYTEDELKAFEEQLAKEMGWGDHAYPLPPGYQQPPPITPQQQRQAEVPQQQVQQGQPVNEQVPLQNQQQRQNPPVGQGNAV